MLLNDADATRKMVQEAYTQAIKSTEEGCCPTDPIAEASCCGPDACGSEIPADAAPEGLEGASFGCGNPLALAALSEGDVVLDLGSGAGLELVAAAARVGETGRVIGVDMTPAMLETARRNIDTAGLAGRVEVREGIIEALPVEDGSVDHVISNCVINLSPDKPAVFAEIARVLKPGGRFSVADIVADELPDDIRKSAAAYAECIAGAIGQREYLDGLRAAGLLDVQVVDRVEYPVPGKVASVRITGRRAG